jgi:glucosyl-dolichyl phosphate glucuronosyltransferase
MISIAIATYNRANELNRTLRGLETLSLGDDLTFEVLVIDNNSNDATRSVAEEFESRLPGPLRYIHEARQGLSHARNRAIEEARSEIVAFLDDDVEVDPRWLIGLASAFASGDAAAVGGRAYLSYPGVKPRWLDGRDEGYLTKVELGPDRRPAAPDELFGVNLAIKKGWVERVGGFRADLGRVGTCLIGSEEGELLERIADAGGTLHYEPSAVVGHRVAAERLSRRWFWSRTYWGHRGEVRRWRRRDANPYALVRATWHVTLATWQLALGSFSTGLLTEETFHRSLILAGRLGTWAGLVAALAGRDPRGLAEPNGRDSTLGERMPTPLTSST